MLISWKLGKILVQVNGKIAEKFANMPILWGK
jgi:hypothetical protein